MLSTMKSSFDPLGFISHVIIELKVLYRFVCEESWGGTKTYLRMICCVGKGSSRLCFYLKSISIPRCLGVRAFEDLPICQLHYFVDASKVAYGAVCYLRTITRNIAVVCSLVMS